MALHGLTTQLKSCDTFLHSYLTVRVHFWCKQMRQQQQLDSRAIRAKEQSKRGAAAAAGCTKTFHQKKLKRLNADV